MAGPEAPTGRAAPSMLRGPPPGEACPPKRKRAIRTPSARDPARRQRRVGSGRAQGERRLGSLGKRLDLRMFDSWQKSITTRSRPMPPPACGKAPYLNELT